MSTQPDARSPHAGERASEFADAESDESSPLGWWTKDGGNSECS
jgi:hypothetical protein